MVIPIIGFFLWYDVSYEIHNPYGSLPKPSPQEVSENSRKEVGKKKKGRWCQFHMTMFTKEYKSRPHNAPQEESSLHCVNNNNDKKKWSLFSQCKKENRQTHTHTRYGSFL